MALSVVIIVVIASEKGCAFGHFGTIEAGIVMNYSKVEFSEEQILKGLDHDRDQTIGVYMLV